MRVSTSRRGFLTKLTASTVALSQLPAVFSHLPSVSAAEAVLDAKNVAFQPEIEPLVRTIEETPRPRLLEEIGRRVQQGLSYRELLAALFLAGVRNVQPRPSVGFKFHAVLVVNSAHLASLASPDQDRWLPVFWALDQFKSSQERDEHEGNWTMPAVDEAALPPAHHARRAFLEAMQAWDESAADVAIASLARTASVNELFEIFAKLGARDFRSIGHKAIYVSNSFRTLQCIGWQHAEPVLRSLAYALLNHEGEPNPASSDLAPDRAWRRNQELVARISDDWPAGTRDDQATTDLLSTLRNDSSDSACDQVVELLNAGVSAGAVYDAFLLGAGELLMRQPGIVALHAVTTTNALHYAFRTCAKPETRKLLLLQNAAFLPLFREAMKGRGKVDDLRIDTLEAMQVPAEEPLVESIFRDVGGQRLSAARKVLLAAEDPAQAEQVMHRARQLVFLKGSDSHDYKFSSAALEDFYQISPTWRSRFLASSVFNLHGSQEQDNPLVDRIRQSLVG